MCIRNLALHFWEAVDLATVQPLACKKSLRALYKGNGEVQRALMNKQPEILVLDKEFAAEREKNI